MKFLLVAVLFVVVLSVPLVAQEIEEPVMWEMTLMNSVNGAAGPKEAPEEPGSRGHKGQPDRSYLVEYMLTVGEVEEVGVIDFKESVDLVMETEGAWTMTIMLPSGEELTAEGEATFGDMVMCHVKRTSEKAVELKCE